MNKPRIVIVDEDLNYILPLQFKFMSEYFEKVDVEIITDMKYCNLFFSKPQNIDVLVMAEKLYTREIQLHNISKQIILCEEKMIENRIDENTVKISKYSNINELFSCIVGNSKQIFNQSSAGKKETKIISVISACGGTGKTTIAMGICEALEEQNMKALYINASRLQNFNYYLKNKNEIRDYSCYVALNRKDANAYRCVKNYIEKEKFFFLPPFKAALMSVGLNYDVFDRIAVSAKAENDFDYIVFDIEDSFDNEKTKLLDASNCVIVVTQEDDRVVYCTNELVSNLSIGDASKYFFVENKYNAIEEIEEKEKKYKVDDKIEYFDKNNMKKEREKLKSSIRKIVYLLA
ncbi:MAG: AAA family ATPase [Lachnospiraceae bacterium]|nr:AAA family ATPase [Lachnospiraceae bacterium]